jgi:hypothetical protein
MTVLLARCVGGGERVSAQARVFIAGAVLRQDGPSAARRARAQPARRATRRVRPARRRARRGARPAARAPCPTPRTRHTRHTARAARPACHNSLSQGLPRRPRVCFACALVRTASQVSWL